MDIAIFADLHSNYLALQTCLEYTEKKNIDHYIFLGDYVGELPYAQKTMSILYKLKKSQKCYFIKGNREQYMLNHLHNPDNVWPDFNSASGCLLNTFEELKSNDLEFFEKMSETMEVVVEDMSPIFCCHGSPDAIGEYVSLKSDRADEILNGQHLDYVLYGHTHIQGINQKESKYLINPGSIGSPIESDNAYTQFCILHSNGTTWIPELISLPYPLEQCIKELYQSNLPKRAPVWCRLTEYCLRNGVPEMSTNVLKRAMELCAEKEGKCDWPYIPEKYWEQAAAEAHIPPMPQIR